MCARLPRRKAAAARNNRIRARALGGLASSAGNNPVHDGPRATNRGPRRLAEPSSLTPRRQRRLPSRAALRACQRSERRQCRQASHETCRAGYFTRVIESNANHTCSTASPVAPPGTLSNSYLHGQAFTKAHWASLFPLESYSVIVPFLRAFAWF